MIPLMDSQTTSPSISVIIPTRNEAENIRPLLTRLSSLNDSVPMEVIFVDDSDDGTEMAIEQVRNQFGFPIRVIHRPSHKRNGLSGAVVDGFHQAIGTWMGVMDADLQHPPEMMRRMFHHAQNTGADVVVGSRAADFKGPKGLSLARTLTSQFLTILARTVFPRLLKNSSDPLTGLFLVRRTAVSIDQLRPDGFKILLEILVRCPNLHVSELFFDFAERHSGESKADFQEGVRFFRHLLKLRWTANIHVTRLGIAAFGVLLLNLFLLIGFDQLIMIGTLVTAVLAMEVSALTLFGLMESWVYFRRTWNGRVRRFVEYIVSSHLLLLIVWFPFVLWALDRGQLSLLSANFIGLLLTGSIRYLFSEQWIWTRGLITHQRESFYYDIHGIVGIESAVHLPDLSYFRVVNPPEHIDIHLLIDRHGTPIQTTESISYSEGLGRFGFSLSIMPGEITEAIASPLLEKSPYVLFKNVLEPILRWVLVRKGFALVYGGTLAVEDQAILIVAGPEIRKAATLIQTLKESQGDFMGDDVAILDKNGRILSFPRLLAIRQHAVDAVDQVQLSTIELILMRLKRLVYDERIRGLGLRLRRMGFPIATLNSYLQRVFPPVKIMMHRLLPDVSYQDEAHLAQVVYLIEGEEHERPLPADELLRLLIANGKKGFGYPPYTHTVKRLSQWRGEDLTAVEEEIIRSAIQNCKATQIQRTDNQWWQDIERNIEKLGVG